MTYGQVDNKPIHVLDANDSFIKLEKYSGPNHLKDIGPGVKAPSAWNKSHFYAWDTIYMYVPSGIQQRLVQSFNNEGKVLVRLSEVPAGLNSWENSLRWSYDYDSLGRLTYSLFEGFYSNSWVNLYCYVYTYSSAGTEMTMVQQHWQGGSWENTSRFTCNYDADGFKIFESYQQWQNSAWENIIRSNFSYDPNHYLLTETMEDWWSNAWEYSMKWTYSYNADYDLLSVMQATYGLGGQWDDFSRDTYTYNASHHRLTALQEYGQGTNWVGYDRSFFTNDPNGNMLEEVYEGWQNNTWNTLRRRNYTYNSDGNSVTGKYEDYNSGSWTPGYGDLKVYSREKENYAFLDHIYRYTATFLLFDNNTGVSGLSPAASFFKVYPNPATTCLNIEIPGTCLDKEGTLSITNLQGQEIMTLPLPKGKQLVDISDLSPGVFFLKLTINSGTAVTKFVKI